MPPEVEKEYLWGRRVLEELLRYHPERIEKLYLSRASERLFKIPSFLKVELKENSELDALIGHSKHQGCAALTKRQVWGDFASFLQSLENLEKSIVVIVDGVEDPQNLGAIFRASSAFGVDAIVVPKHGSAPLSSAVVAKASAGASTVLPAFTVPNLKQAIERLREKDFWTVASTVDPEASSLRAFEFPKKTALIVGSEGDGIRKSLLESSDFKVYIPITGKIESLNVSQALSVFLYAFSNS